MIVRVHIVFIRASSTRRLSFDLFTFSGVVSEAAVRKYCNEELKVVPGEGGFINSPGYPLYYLGESTCGWTFRSAPGHRIVLTFHDLNIRGKYRSVSPLFPRYPPHLEINLRGSCMESIKKSRVVCILRFKLTNSLIVLINI